MQKIIVTGSSGMVGLYLVLVLQKYYDVYPFSHQQLDITDKKKLKSIFEKVRPSVVIHLAALTNVDLCQEQENKAYAINTEGTDNIVCCCETFGSTLVYLSTGMVFDGKKTLPYSENDSVAVAVNTYGQSKLFGEQNIQKKLSNFYILRTTWLFGGGKKDKKFVGKMIELGQKYDSVSVVNDTWGTPTYTYDLSLAICEICRKSPAYGIYHLANGGVCNRVSFAEKIFSYAKITCRVEGVSSETFPTLAPRPINESITSSKFHKVYKMRTWEKALYHYITSEL
ncbi:dTDP-4-dehydrorhamnose reductase [Candidatus Uabimicrobium sp. HlEnr_7]|uniref:dTDP-4-dehydrorhamnose reductase n=1 Tax=Candidatus Uabimicrobium helgolandensis TaxID=3095367 RepID=UPI003558951F